MSEAANRAAGAIQIQDNGAVSEPSDSYATRASTDNTNPGREPGDQREDGPARGAIQVAETRDHRPANCPGTCPDRAGQTTDQRVLSIRRALLMRGDRYHRDTDIDDQQFADFGSEGAAVDAALRRSARGVGGGVRRAGGVGGGVSQRGRSRFGRGRR